MVTISKHQQKKQKQQERREEREHEHIARKQSNRSKKRTMYMVSGFIILILIGGATLLLKSTSGTPGKYDTFAQCITEQGATMYGAYWCPHCADQKQAFGKSVKYVDYVECDPKGKDAQPGVCTSKNIQSYPTWIVNGEMYKGVQPLTKLAELTGCELTL